MGKTFIKIAAVYFSIGVLLGMTMGMIHDFRLTSLHAHVNLLGWVSMAIFGIIYSIYPSVSTTKLAKTHFWLHNIGLPIMIVGSLAVVIGTLIFTTNILKTLKSNTNLKANQDIKA